VTARLPLEDLLDGIADALQRGALGELAHFSAALDAEFADLQTLDASRAEGLRRRAARNDLCLQAAARGVRAAITRISGIASGGSQLSTYGSDGRKTQVSGLPAQRWTRL
jgi:hypothetical protein